jgi:hypothetical protein
MEAPCGADLRRAASADSSAAPRARRTQYEPFYADFGPLNLGKAVIFCRMLKALLESPEAAGREVVFYTADGETARSNGAVLIGMFQILCLKRSADDGATRRRACVGACVNGRLTRLSRSMAVSLQPEELPPFPRRVHGAAQHV